MVLNRIRGVCYLQGCLIILLPVGWYGQYIHRYCKYSLFSLLTHPVSVIPYLSLATIFPSSLPTPDFLLSQSLYHFSLPLLFLILPPPPIFVTPLQLLPLRIASMARQPSLDSERPIMTNSVSSFGVVFFPAFWIFLTLTVPRIEIPTGSPPLAVPRRSPPQNVLLELCPAATLD